MTTQKVRIILSPTCEEARKNTVKLYKAWYRQLPYILKEYDIPKTVCDLRLKLREEFRKHDPVDDIRVIDMLILKGQMELRETVNKWKQKNTLMDYYKDSVEVKPKGFLSKFLEGHE